MTKEELLAKNKAIRLARELNRAQINTKEPKPVEVVEEKNQEPEVFEEEGKREEMVELEENQIVIEEKKEEIVKEDKNSTVEIPLDEIRSNPYQPRTVFDEEALKSR